MSKRPTISSISSKPKSGFKKPNDVVKETTTEPVKKRTLKERGKQVIMIINKSAHDDLKVLAIKEDKQLNDLYVEAINLLFKKRKLDSKADLGD